MCIVPMHASSRMGGFAGVIVGEGVCTCIGAHAHCNLFTNKDFTILNCKLLEKKEWAALIIVDFYMQIAQWGILIMVEVAKFLSSKNGLAFFPFLSRLEEESKTS